jgi:RNA methyltransferase, TrmH family
MEEALLKQWREQGIPVFTITPEVLAAVTETVTPQGIVAVVHIPQLTPPDPPGLVLVLDQVREPGNAGTLLRSAAAAGVDLVLFAPETVDPYNDKVLRAAMGAHFRLPIQIYQQWQEIITTLDRRACYAADAAGEVAYDQVDWTEPAAIIIGGEASGPSAEAQQLATRVAIPMHRQTESLNAAVAGSVILFEAARQRRN